MLTGLEPLTQTTLPGFSISIISNFRFLFNLTSHFMKQSIVQAFDQMRVFHIP